MKSLLTKAGYQFDPREGLWLRSDYQGISYSDGDEVEQRIRSIVNNAKDLSTLSAELSYYCTDWPSLYHLSGTRANVLRPFEHILKGDTLEIGAGCGAITRYIGECGGNVLALEGSPRRAAIARSRTRDLQNIEIISETFEQFAIDKKFDVVTLIGVLEYANLFVSGENSALEMLQKARSFLKPNGKLIIAIENQLGLKYFAGAPEDHVGIPMYGIEGRYQKNEVTTFGRKELSNLVSDAGFSSTEFLASFPDYKLPSSIVTEAGFNEPKFDATAFATQTVERDPQLPSELAFSLTSTWATVVKNHLALDLANSFIVVAGNDASPLLTEHDLAWHFTTERKKQFCKIAHFAKKDHSNIEVHYHSLASGKTETESQGKITQHIPPQSEYVVGKPLALELTEILNRENWRVSDVADFFKKYLLVLSNSNLGVADNIQLDLQTPNSIAPGVFFDCVPQNLIITGNGKTIFIDQEWEVPEGIELGHLMLRALTPHLHWASENKTSDFDGTRIGLLRSVAASIGWAISDSQFKEYCVREVALQNQIHTQSFNLQKLIDWLYSPLKPKVTIYQKISEYETQITQFKKSLADSDEKIEHLTQKALENEAQINELYRKQNEILQSRSWRITAPMRITIKVIRRFALLLRNMPDIVDHHGGIANTVKKTLSIFKREGINGIINRIRSPRPLPTPNRDRLKIVENTTEEDFGIVPYYMDPLLDSVPPEFQDVVSIAVHIYLSHENEAGTIARWLNNIPCSFDLLVSLPEEIDSQVAKERLKTLVPTLKKVLTCSASNQGEPLVSMITGFGNRLQQYDIIGNFHLGKEVTDNETAEKYAEKCLNLLLGEPATSGGRLGHIFQKLKTNIKFVYAESTLQYYQDCSRWGEFQLLARQLLKDTSSPSLNDFPVIEFPESGMLWARSNCLLELSKLSKTVNDLSSNDTLAPDALEQTLRRLTLISANQQAGKCLRLHQEDSIKDYIYYEEQKDYSESIKHTDTKILAYYLPQFHPIPENDEWHGKGFTEWTKVRAANPLFNGHYQQHIPHSDIGYYLLDTPETLRKQADLMKKSGVYGQVFYHYWFGGKLILERPAQLLLETGDIEMPFCFCWANENWTRRWDGNESEILLGQNYSAQDAAAFIDYLMPFFKDERYIKIDERPVLFVYRPSSIENHTEYLKIWEEKCTAEGLKKPYVVAVLTRGATNPRDYEMDAGVERILHDWTDGAVPELKHNLATYENMNGSVLAYSAVADFYRNQTERKPFTYFRSLAPMWDNTARYGPQALLLHGSTPKLFQDWLEDSITYTVSNLPSDRRFILINAWNEWAEGAHLEPDTRYGYSYLNSIGRALSNIKFDNELNKSTPLPEKTILHLSISPSVAELITKDNEVRTRFLNCLAQSSVVGKYAVTTNLSTISHQLSNVLIGDETDADYTVCFSEVTYFAPDTLEKLLQTSCATNLPIIANCYGYSEHLIRVAENGAVSINATHTEPLKVIPYSQHNRLFKTARMRTDAHCFYTFSNKVEKPRITTIVRFHKSAKQAELINALYVLYAMADCQVTPLIAAQDLTEQQISDLKKALTQFKFPPSSEPVIDLYRSENGHEDLRSKMLNQSLKKVNTKYVAFLDFDDLLLPCAYSALINRLQSTGKAVTFGRVFSTLYRSADELLLNRKKEYEFGNSYEDYINNNFAPIHSLVIDLEKVDLTSIHFHEQHKYMEDYYLMLQVISKENTDWESLNQNLYIGDYVHSLDREHTLAIHNTKKKESLLEDEDYLSCYERIQQLRKSKRNG